MVHVTSEVGRLREVLVHEPGREIDRMVPAMMEELLFDDILDGDRAREEHTRFRRILTLMGVQVLETQDLLAETLAHPEARDWLVQTLFPASGLRDNLAALDGEQLAEALIAGVEAGKGEAVEDLFPVFPLPNWCFQRDPQVVIGDGVLFGAMATRTRWHEAMVSRLVFRFHPRFSDVPVIHDPYAHVPSPAGFESLAGSYVEGGDVLVLSRDVIAVGISERTNRKGVEAIARALAGRENGPRWIIVVEMPHQRAFMHLDTLLTPVDRNACLVYPPVILGKGGATRVYEVDLQDPDRRFQNRKDVMGTLKQRGLDFEPIPCGGDDPIGQQREQWTDGANALAVAPGVIFLYRRNVRTAEELNRRGFRIVTAEDILLGRDEIDLEDGSRTCVLISSHEIARARGGPHCLTHPLLRDELD